MVYKALSMDELVNYIVMTSVSEIARWGVREGEPSAIAGGRRRALLTEKALHPNIVE